MIEKQNKTDAPTHPTMYRPLAAVSCKYGAPMGRRDTIPQGATYAQARITLERLVLVDGDYDAGGAYWGASPINGDIWRAVGVSDDGEPLEVFTRAKSRMIAEQEINDVVGWALSYVDKASQN